MEDPIKFNPNHFREIFPDEVFEVLQLVMAEEFQPSLVGGAVRDFLMKGELSKDLDFEIRHSSNFTASEWGEKLNHLYKKLKLEFDCEQLSFKIIRLKYNGFDLEFSSPRIERYGSGNVFGHSDLDVELRPQLDFKLAVQRRDFTINAIYISINRMDDEMDFKLIDPLSGANDLKNEKLRPCGQDFYLDPVRFLRAIRFGIKLGFSDEPVEYSRFNLEKLGTHHFFEEAGKCGDLLFFNKFFHTVSECGVELSGPVRKLEVLKNLPFGYWSGSSDQLAVMVLFQGLLNSEESWKEFTKAMNISKKLADKSWNIYSRSQTIGRLDRKRIMELSVEEFGKTTEFALIKSLDGFIKQYPWFNDVISPFEMKEILNPFIECCSHEDVKNSLKKGELEKIEPGLRTAFFYQVCLSKGKTFPK